MHKRPEDLYNCSHLPFHISARTNNKEFFILDLRDCWDIFVDYLYGLDSAFGVRIHSFVLMSNHYHMLAAFPEANRGEAMCWFQTQVAKVVNFNCKRINHLWGNRYHGSLITNSTYYSYAYKYIYRNPVEAGLCNKPWNYQYSTLSGQLGFSKYCIPLRPTKSRLENLIPKDLDDYMAWLSNELPAEFNDLYWNSWRKKELQINSRHLKNIQWEQ